MKKLLLVLLLIITITSCTNNDEECEDLLNDYITALSHAGTSQTAINEVNRQYNVKKQELGCD